MIRKCDDYTASLLLELLFLPLREQVSLGFHAAGTALAMYVIALATVAVGSFLAAKVGCLL